MAAGPRKQRVTMKADIHPEYITATVKCSCGNTFTTHSTKAELTTELCSECHPLYTGKQKLVDTGGRIEKFEKRYGRRSKATSDAD
jgi:large subunit ribosomal protein L31